MKKYLLIFVALALLLLPGGASAVSLRQAVQVRAAVDDNLSIWNKLQHEFKQVEVEIKKEDKAAVNPVRLPPVKQADVTGMVLSVSSTLIKVQTNDNALFYVDASHARLIRRFGASMTLGEIAVNDTLHITGTWMGQSGNEISATLIRDLSVQARNANFTGLVSAIDAVNSRFVLTVKDDQKLTVTVTASTTITRNGRPAVFSDLALDQKATVAGVWDRANSTLIASKVNIASRIEPIFLTGTVTAKASSTLTVQNAKGTVYTVDVSKTMLVGDSFTAITLADIALNDRVTIGGLHLTNSTSVNAFIVWDRTTTTTS